MTERPTLRLAVLVPLVSCFALFACTESRQRFEVVEGGYAVVDHQTGLVWQRCAEGMGTQWPPGRDGGCFGHARVATWGTAMEIAQSRAQSSGKAWRLPTVHELNSIVDDEQAHPALNPRFFPSFSDDRTSEGERRGRLHPFWTINAHANDPMSGSAWVVDLSEGEIANQDISLKAYIRLVRPQ